MSYDKGKYESLIEESVLFSIDKDSQKSLYKRESLKLVEYLYCYLLSVNRDKYESYGCEIVDVATRCINAYDGRGDFLHYFNAAWKKEYSHICGNQIIEDKLQGVKITEQEKREAKKLLKLLSKRNSDRVNNALYAEIAIFMDISEERVAEIARIAGIQIIGEYSNNLEGEELSIWDSIASDVFTEGSSDEQCSFVETMQIIENVFAELQDRQQPIVSDMLTIKLGMDFIEQSKVIKDFSFINNEMMREISDTGIVPTQRNIAEKYNRNEASISRTMKEFLKKVEESLSRRE